MLISLLNLDAELHLTYVLVLANVSPMLRNVNEIRFHFFASKVPTMALRRRPKQLCHKEILHPRLDATYRTSVQVAPYASPITSHSNRRISTGKIRDAARAGTRVARLHIASDAAAIQMASNALDRKGT